MTEADYLTAIDDWFEKNGHPIRTSYLQRSAWEAFFTQGLAPTVAAQRILATAPRNVIYAPPTAAAPNVNQISATPQPAIPGSFQRTFGRIRPNTNFLRRGGTWLYWIGIVQAAIFGLVAAFLFVTLTYAYFQVGQKDRTPSERTNTFLAYMTFLIPVWGVSTGFIAGLVEALLGQFAIILADFYEERFGIP